MLLRKVRRGGKRKKSESPYCRFAAKCEILILPFFNLVPMAVVSGEGGHYSRHIWRVAD